MHMPTVYFKRATLVLGLYFSNRLRLHSITIIYYIIIAILNIHFNNYYNHYTCVCSPYLICSLTIPCCF